MAKEQIDIFTKTIKEQLLGPGSDVFYSDNEDEIIAGFPLRRYYTGVLFPEKIIEKQCDNDAEIADDSDDGLEYIEEKNDDITEQEDETTPKKDIKDNDKENINLSNHFHPSNMGISFCVDEQVESLKVNFSFATYEQAKQTEVKVDITENAYHNLIDDKYGFPFRDILDYEEIDEQNGYLSLNRELKGKKKDRTGEYAQFDDWKKSIDADYREILRPLHEKFNKIIARLWRRIPNTITENIKLENNNKPIPLTNFPKAGWALKAYQKGGQKYIKIQLVNLFKAIPNNQFSNSKEQLNESCLFQAEISIHSDKLLPYKPYDSNKNYFDKEKQTLDFLYRKVKHFAIGSNCSAVWKPLENPKKITTSFLPTYNLKSTETKIEGFADIALFDLSIWGKNQKEITQDLNNFVDKYTDWIEKQKQNDDANTDVGKNIISNLDATANRLKQGVQILADNSQLFKAFQYANTAMLLQFSLKDDFYQAIQKSENEQCPCSEEQKKNITYRPFQLAFFLLSLESTVNPQSKYRKQAVDLIWFPTGGGKTEAYLAVAALTIIWRRMTNEKYQGVSVIMRYTLRLLTAQQFERATKLIIVLEYLRQQFSDDLKDKEINIGLWIGGSSTPNNIKDAEEATKNITNKGADANKFQIDTCPWCNQKLIKEKGKTHTHAFEARRRNLKIKCLNKNCDFSKGSGLPVQVVDEVLYDNPPTLLFATVDKMAMLSWQEKGHKFFNSLGDENDLPPDLIIQDELHLLTGPLGSIVGLFETVIEDLCTKNGSSPKIIASTATTRNTSEQVKQLYGNRSVNIFPPSGLTYDDSFFFKESEDSKRQYLGFMPTGKTGVDSQIHLLTILFIARLKIYLADKTQTNPYWTLVSYYNNLRDVGRMSNKVGDEIQTLIKQTQKRLQLAQNGFNYFGLKSRTKELTSRIESAKIKQNLDQLEQNFALNKPNDRGYKNVKKEVVDLVLATNMLSVGIDIDRLNMMLINGMPRNTAEYIQASSRVGRKDKGLVVAFFDANRARDKSYFEHFLSFHQSLYKQIEPLSITPFTQNTIDKMIASLMITYVRHKQNLNKNDAVKHFTKDRIKDLKILLQKRFPNDENMKFCIKKLDELADDWVNKIQQETPYNKYSGKESALLAKPDSKHSLTDTKWVVMQSMRDIDSSSFIQIQQNYE